MKGDHAGTRYLIMHEGCHVTPRQELTISLQGCLPSKQSIRSRFEDIKLRLPWRTSWVHLPLYSSNPPVPSARRPFVVHDDVPSSQGNQTATSTNFQGGSGGANARNYQNRYLGGCTERSTFADLMHSIRKATSVGGGTTNDCPRVAW